MCGFRPSLLFLPSTSPCLSESTVYIIDQRLLRRRTHHTQPDVFLVLCFILGSFFRIIASFVSPVSSCLSVSPLPPASYRLPLFVLSSRYMTSLMSKHHSALHRPMQPYALMKYIHGTLYTHHNHHSITHPDSCIHCCNLRTPTLHTLNLRPCIRSTKRSG